MPRSTSKHDKKAGRAQTRSETKAGRAQTRSKTKAGRAQTRSKTKAGRAPSRPVRRNKNPRRTPKRSHKDETFIDANNIPLLGPLMKKVTNVVAGGRADVATLQAEALEKLGEITAAIQSGHLDSKHMREIEAQYENLYQNLQHGKSRVLSQLHAKWSKAIETAAANDNDPLMLQDILNALSEFQGEIQRRTKRKERPSL